MKISDSVLDVLSQAETDGSSLRLVGQLDRKLYVETNKVLEAVGGKWNRSAKAHLFPRDAAESIEELVLTGEVTSAKKDFDYFATPPDVVERLFEMADIHALDAVLEPSAGMGAIALPLADLGCVVDCVELLPANHEVLSESFPGAKLADFLTTSPDAKYDRIVMNPPFTRQADIHHVIHANKFLRDGGLLVSVMANSVGFRSNALTVGFRGFVADRGGSITALPDGSFKASGTMVNTVVVVIPT
jgi:predicted RNA methylase